MCLEVGMQRHWFLRELFGIAKLTVVPWSHDPREQGSAQVY